METTELILDEVQKLRDKFDQHSDKIESLLVSGCPMGQRHARWLRGITLGLIGVGMAVAIVIVILIGSQGVLSAAVSRLGG